MDTLNIVLGNAAPAEDVVRSRLGAAGAVDVAVFGRLGMATCRADPAASAAIAALDFVEAVRPDREVRLDD